MLEECSSILSADAAGLANWVQNKNHQSQSKIPPAPPMPSLSPDVSSQQDEQDDCSKEVSITTMQEAESAQCRQNHSLDIPTQARTLAEEQRTKIFQRLHSDRSRSRSPGSEPGSSPDFHIHARRVAPIENDSALNQFGIGICNIGVTVQDRCERTPCGREELSVYASSSEEEGSDMEDASARRKQFNKLTVKSTSPASRKTSKKDRRKGKKKKKVAKQSKAKSRKKKHAKKKKKHAKKRKKRKSSSSSSLTSSVSAESMDPADAFSKAIEQGDILLGQHIVRRSGFQWHDAAGNGPLHLAARCNRPELVAWILALPGSAKVVDACNMLGETPLLVAARLFRGTVALRLVEALADPCRADHSGNAPESFDLDGLLRETEIGEACERRKEQERALAAVTAARKSREEAEWRERLFFDIGVDEGEPFPGFADLEYQDIASEGRDWTDEIALEVAARCRQERAARVAEYAKCVEDAKRKARAEADAQEARARAFAREAAAAGTTYKNASSGNSTVSSQQKFSAEDHDEKRLQARAADEARWRNFEDKVATLSKAASAMSDGGDSVLPFELHTADIPWPSGPSDNPLRIDPGGHPAMVRSQLRSGLLRWHPDKFEQRVGRFFADGMADKEQALARVKSIAQQLNELMASLTSEKGAEGQSSGKTNE